MSRSVLLCACVLVVLTISAPQMEVNLPVRQVVMELGLLQGQCPSSASGSGRMPASGIPSGDVSASGLPQAQSGSASGTGASAGGSASGSVSGTGASAGGTASGSVSETGASAGGSASGSVSGTGASAGGSASGSVSGTGASVGGSASGSASGTGASGFPRAQSGSSSGSPESSGSGVPIVFRNRRNAEGSTVNASGSGSGDICSNAFEILGPFCTRVLEAQFCQFNFSLQTCNFCANLSSSCGQPMGSISTLCASQNANSCSQSAGICLVQTADSMVCDYCAFVGSMCYQGREFELCSVNGLVDGCTNILRGSYECECFLPSSQCSFCRNLIRVCATTIPVSLIMQVVELFIFQVF